MELLKELVNAFGPSGYEQPVREILMRELKKHVDEVHVDKFGNLIGHKKGAGSKVMLAAHMDEIGLMVRKVTSEGHLHLAAVGGVDPLSIVGQQAIVKSFNGSYSCTGIITFADMHNGLEIEELPGMDGVYVDVGLSRSQLAKKGISVGSYVVPNHHFAYLGSNQFITGKALDNRVGCYALLEVARKLKRVKTPDVYFIFTVQEEIGMHGAKVSTYELDPDWGVAVDTIEADDAETDAAVSLGKGPALLLMDSEVITNRCLNEHLMNLSKHKKIPLQLKVEDAGTTDATNIMLTKTSVPSASLVVPVRNIHTTVSVSHTKDIDNMIKLLVELLKKPPKICLV
jgi:tetrahedral aminopeptidase